MMTDYLMKNWLAGRKENQLEDTTGALGSGGRRRERKMDEYWIEEMDQDNGWED